MLCSLRFTQHIALALATTSSVRASLAFRLNAQSRTQKKVGKKQQKIIPLGKHPAKIGFYGRNRRIGFYGKNLRIGFLRKSENWLFKKIGELASTEKLENQLLRKNWRIGFYGKNWRIGFYRKKLKNWLLQEKIEELAFTGKN